MMMGASMLVDGRSSLDKVDDSLSTVIKKTDNCVHVPFVDSFVDDIGPDRIVVTRQRGFLDGVQPFSDVHHFHHQGRGVGPVQGDGNKWDNSDRVVEQTIQTTDLSTETFCVTLWTLRHQVRQRPQEDNTALSFCTVKFKTCWKSLIMTLGVFLAKTPM
jgi:hypothetical protein